MNRVAIAWATVCIGAAVYFAACALQHGAPAGGDESPSTTAPSVGTTTPGPGAVGVVDGQLTLSGGVQLTSLSWTIQGPNTYTGVVVSADGTSFWVGGLGVPAGGSPALTTLPGLPTVTSTSASPWQFVLVQLNAASSGFDTLYVANDRAVGSGPMGVQRFSLSGGSWTLTANLTLPAPDGGAPVGFRGLAGLKTGAAQVTLIATTVEPTAATRIAVFTDDGTSSPWAGTSRVIAVANGQQEFFRGVALSPHP